MKSGQRVNSSHDARLHDFVGLTDVALRRRTEIEDGLFVAEGAKVIRRAVAAGYAPRAFLLEEKWLDGLGDVLASSGDAPVYLADAEVLREVTGYGVHRGALASMHRRPLPSPDELLAGSNRIAVVEDLVDATNLGAVFRGAAALGIEAVLLTPRCADPLYRRSVKVSMGSVFNVPYARFSAWPQCFSQIHEAGFTLVAMTPAAGSMDLPELLVPARAAVLLGTEGPGLSDEALASADLRVRIPMDAGVDSLNIAAAAAVAFYAMRYPRR